MYESSKSLQWRLPSFLQIPFYAETATKHFLLLGQCVLGTEVDIPPTPLPSSTILAAKQLPLWWKRECNDSMAY